MLPGYIISKQNLNSYRYTDSTVLVIDGYNFLDKVIMESRKKRQTINCKILECITDSNRKNLKAYSELEFWK